MLLKPPHSSVINTKLPLFYRPVAVTTTNNLIQQSQSSFIISSSKRSLSSSSAISSSLDSDNNSDANMDTDTDEIIAAKTHKNFIHDSNNNSFIKSHFPTDKVVEVDIHSYLNAIEKELESIPNDVLKVKIRPQNSRPMIRTLLGISSKDEFYNLCRMTRNQIAYHKMLEFVLLFQEEVIQSYDLDYIQEQLPHFQSCMEKISKEPLSTSDVNNSTKRGAQHFSRIPSGRTYKGRFETMVKGLTPHLIDKCNEAMTDPSDAEVLLDVIDRITAANKDIDASGDTASDTVLSEERIQAARECVIGLHRFGNDSQDDNEDDDENDGDINNDDENDDGNNMFRAKDKISNDNSSKANGLECEQACISYLEQKSYFTSPDDDEHETIDFILQNVVVNNKLTQSRSKYSMGNMKNSKGGWKRIQNDDMDDGKHNNDDQSKNKTSSSKLAKGIIWTSDGGRSNKCSEFDAMVLHQSKSNSNCQVSEFWEAKYLVSPSSIHDALTKKLSAIRSVVEDDDVTVSYNGSHYTLTERKGRLTRFGLFGMELLSPSNSIGQLRSTAASYALTNYVNAALQAANTGYVDVKVDYLQQNISGLKKALQSSEDFEIIMKIAK